VDNRIIAFRDNENLSRINLSANRLAMPEIPASLWSEAVDRVVIDNLDYVPPASSKGALYIRPMLFGSGPTLGVSPSNEYTFAVVVNPVGN